MSTTTPRSSIARRSNAGSVISRPWPPRLHGPMDRKVSDLPLLTHGRKTWLIDDLNQTSVSYDRRPVHVLALCPLRQPSSRRRSRAEHAGHSITYGELEARSNQLALYLQTVIPEPGQRIALLVERSLEMLVALDRDHEGRPHLCSDGSVPSGSPAAADARCRPGRWHHLRQRSRWSGLPPQARR